MSNKIIKLIFHGVVSTTLFSLWAAFALLVVNKLYHKNLPGYTIGRICIWEFVAIVIAVALGHFMINRWGSLESIEVNGQRRLVMSPQFGIYFLLYLLLAIIIGIWQFWIFSQQF